MEFEVINPIDRGSESPMSQIERIALIENRLLKRDYGIAIQKRGIPLDVEMDGILLYVKASYQVLGNCDGNEMVF